jgi:nucleotide-binding universal stress UspA family protein
MVPVPDQVPLYDAEKYMREGQEGIIEAMLRLGLEFPVSTHLRYCRNVARGIVSAVREKKINMLVMGWHGKKSHPHFTLGSTLDPIVERSPCDVVILKDCGGNRTFKRILVPLAGGPNSAFALEVAGILADREEGKIVALSIDSGREFDIQAFVSEHYNPGQFGLPSERISTRIIPADNVARAILAEAHSEEYDLVVLGCTGDPILLQRVSHPIPETVAAQCTLPVAIVKTNVGLRSWLKRWL